jgi:hypothetical protein
MAALAQAAESSAGRLLHVDFDQFLINPTSLLEILRHFDIEATADEVKTILEGPDLRRYSKAPEYAYDAALRLQILEQARASHAAEIHRGLAWLDRAGSKWPAIGRAIALGDAPPGRGQTRLAPSD